MDDIQPQTMSNDELMDLLWQLAYYGADDTEPKYVAVKEELLRRMEGFKRG